MSRRALIWSVSILAALLAVLIIVVVILIGTMNRQAEDAAYRACAERLTAGATTVDEVARAAEFCSR